MQLEPSERLRVLQDYVTALDKREFEKMRIEKDAQRREHRKVREKFRVW